MVAAADSAMTAATKIQPAQRFLRVLIVAAGIGTAVIFVAAGVSTRLQMFGDGSIFSYAVAAQSAWSFHWHNISGRLFTYVFAYILPEAYVALTENARGGILIYGLLFFSGPLLGLLATLAADRTSGRTIFAYACFSTACLCPLVYGAPTEMWMAHSLFWPTLAAALFAPANWRGAAVVFVGLLALVFTHEGAIVLSAAILFALFLRGWRDVIFIRAVRAFAIVMIVWLIVKLTERPDAYIAGVLTAAAYRFIDIDNLVQPAVLSLFAALTGYAIMVVALRRMNSPSAPGYAAAICAAALAVYWIWFDNSVLADARYDLRTALLIGTPALGVLATVHVMGDQSRRKSAFPFLSQWTNTIEKNVNPQIIAGALVLTMLVYAVETTKFVGAWIDYEAALRALATGTNIDPALGDPLFVSAKRIGADLNRLGWDSTTPFLSVLVAPGLKPTRLVVDPDANYFWLSCQTATESERTSIAIPAASRRLIRIHACLHR